MVGIRWELPANQVTNERYPEHFNWGAKTFYPDEVEIVMLLASSVKSPAATPFSASAPDRGRVGRSAFVARAIVGG